LKTVCVEEADLRLDVVALGIGLLPGEAVGVDDHRAVLALSDVRIEPSACLNVIQSGEV
jgi:hypothetical protein